MTPDEILQARAKAELELFFLMTVEEGVKLLQWMEATEPRLPPSLRSSGSSTSEGSKARARGGRREEGSGLE